MAATVIYGDTASEVAAASAQGDNLWLPFDEVHRTTGWELKPEGVCKGEVCVPIPPHRRDEFVGADKSFNLANFARHLGQAVVHEDAHAVWFFGEASEARRNHLMTLEAPDFTLPDIDGKRHSLSDYRGKKVLLLSWASW
jgi:AhpC/TSA family